MVRGDHKTERKMKISSNKLVKMHLIYIISVHVVYCDTKQISEFLREDAFLGEGGTGYSDGNIPRSLGKATPMICFLE